MKKIKSILESKVFAVIVSQFFNEVSSRYYSIINYTYIPVLEVLRFRKTRPQFFHGSLSRASSCKKATTYPVQTGYLQVQFFPFSNVFFQTVVWHELPYILGYYIG